jgi:alkylated DNA repair dioxygenase AlkB
MTAMPTPTLPADVAYDPGFLDPVEADGLFTAIATEVPWGEERVVIAGVAHVARRRSCWMGDPGRVYRYSGIARTPAAWTPAVATLRRRVEAELGRPFDSVLVNLYRDGGDRMGWHADDERDLGHRPVIASVSLGAVRRFAFRRRVPSGETLALDLAPGSLLVMAGDCQRDWQHALKPTARPVGPRINLTFRLLRP